MSSKVFVLDEVLPPENTSLGELEDTFLWGWVISEKGMTLMSKGAASSNKNSVKVWSPTSGSSIDPKGATEFGSACSGADDAGTDVGA